MSPCASPGACLGGPPRSPGGSQALQLSHQPSAIPAPCCSATSASWLCPERSQPHPGHRGTHSSCWVGNKSPCGLGPKAGGGQRVPAPCTILSGVGRWPWPNPSLLTRAEAARARGCWAGRPGCCRHARPWSCTADQARPAPRCSHTEPNPTSSGALSV